MPRRRLSVTTYLLAAFGTCAVFLAVVVGLGTQQSFERERAHTRNGLRSITRQAQYDNSGWAEDIESVGEGLATDPRLRSGDQQQCEAVFAGLASFLESDHLHVLAADGTEVCAAYGPGTTPAPLSKTGWFEEVVDTGDTVVSDPEIDPSTGRPALVMAIPYTDAAGAVIGAIAYVADTWTWGIPIPSDAPEGAVILVVDRHRDLVLSASSNAPVTAGDRIGDTPLGRGVRAGHSVTDVDGEERIYEDVTIDENGWHVLAGVSSDVALAPAQAELRRNVVAGAISLGFVFLLGGLLHRRLAGPIRRVGRAISASLGGDDDARAPLEGPAELAHVANAFNDLIDERQAREAELWHRARHDALTGLPNRMALSEHLGFELQLATTAPARGLAVLFLDLDRFKHINDAYGHATGDRVLIELGERLQTVLPDAFVSRFGGDEYVLVVTGAHDRTMLAALAEQVAAALKAPVDVDGADLHLTGSVGIAVAHDGDTAEDLIRNADTAMYRSKERGTDGYAVFDQPMREWVMHRASTERDLHQALERGELFLSYQPKVALTRGGPAGFEALARWNHPTRGLVPPGEFIPIAEDSGLISDIGAWALEQACRQAAEWRALNGGLAVPVAVNLAARQLADPRLPDLIARTLEVAGARSGDLVLEITESAVLGDIDAVSKRLRRLRDAGVRISVDDFGTGYSSLSYLQQLPIDELKIDRAFVSKLPFEPSSTAIIGSVIDLAHAIGLRVVAEGVETGEQLTALRGLGCDLAQGFYIARPEPAEEATARLQCVIDSARRARDAALRV